MPEIVGDSRRYGSKTRFGTSNASLASSKSDLDDTAIIEAHVQPSVETLKGTPPVQPADVKQPWWKPRRGWPGRARKSHSIANMESIKSEEEATVDEEEEEQVERYIGMEDM